MAKSKSGSKKNKSQKPGQRGFGQAPFAGFQKSAGSSSSIARPKIVQRANRGK